MHTTTFLSYLLPTLFSIATIAGLIAVVRPSWFVTVAQKCNRWFDINRVVEVLDRPIDIDSKVLKHTRLLGSAVLASVLSVAFLLYG